MSTETSLFLYGLLFYSFAIGFKVCDSYECSFNPILNGNGTIVETESGRISGQFVQVLNSTVITFFGIPYAKPPVKDKRFTKPVPIEKWQGTWYASEKPPACMQYTTRYFPWSYLGAEKSEDCLYLNIWVPALNYCRIPHGLPVMVYIHGGGFYTGASRMDELDATVLASRAQVIVVSMNYRVGILGFLNAATTDAPGNVGMLDQLLAMKWTKENIHNFGGDPNKITLAGQSAGSICVGLHLMSPLSRGLFQRAIMLSVPVISPGVISDSISEISKSNMVSEKVGCSNKNINLTNNPIAVVDCLRRKNATELVKAEDIYSSKFPIFFAPFFGSSCDGCTNFLPQSPIELLLSQQFPQVPVIMGATKTDGSIFLAYARPDIFSLYMKPNITLDLVEEISPTLLPQVSDKIAKKVFNYYLHSLKSKNSDDLVETLTFAFEDFTMYCPFLYMAENIEEAYFYLLTYKSSSSSYAEWVGVTHCDDLQYIFGKPLINDQLYTSEDKLFSADLIEKLGIFMKFGFPFSERSEHIWPRFSSKKPVHIYELNIKKEGSILFPRQDACEYLRPLILGDDY